MKPEWSGMIRELETERLWLRPLELADAEQAQPLFARWEVVQFLNDKVPWPFPEDGVRAYYSEAALPAMERGEEWHWTLRLKTAPEQVIGSIGLMREARKDEGYNRGFWIAPEWEGRGLMTEAVIAVNEYWFGELGFAVMRTGKAAANAGSRRISEKTGMRLVGTKMGGYVSGVLPTEVWEITAEEWRAWRLRRRDHGPGTRK